MGIHEIESLVEESVRLLDRGAHDRGLDMRSLLWNLYDYQRGYDTGNTLFRVVTILVRHRYLYAFPLSEHPDYLRQPDSFAALQLRGFEEIPVEPGKPWHDRKNPTAGYFCDPVREWGASFREKNDWGDLARPLLYCEAGSPLWKQFVASKALTGSDAKQPEWMDRSDLFHSVIQEALRQGNDKLAAEWYQVGIPYEFASADSKVGARLKEDSHLVEIRELGRKHRLHALLVDRGFHEAEDVDLDNPFLTWWWTDFVAEDERDGDRARPPDMTATAPEQGPLEPKAVSDLEGSERSSTSLQYMARREQGLWDAGHLTTLFSVTDQAARRTNINRAVMDLWKQTDPSLRQASDLPALTDGQKRELFSLLFSVLEETHSKTDDTIRLFWEGLLGEITPGRTYLSIVTAQGREFLTEWIVKLEQERPAGLSPGFFRAVRVYLGEQGNTLDTAVSALRGLLEDPDSFVRANVGRRWAYLLSRERPQGGWKKAIQILSETEIQFPGALAPFLNTMLNADKRVSQPGGVFAKSREDLVDVLCRRQVPEPDHPPFELLETFLARHVAGNSELLRRLLQAGFGRPVLIALQGFGSKDTRHEFLPELARDPDERIARDACIESIRDRIPLPENAQKRGLAKRFEGPGIVVTVIRHDAGGQAYDWLYAVLSPVDKKMWSVDAAWRAVDAMLPPGVRGDAQRIYQFPRGPEVTFGLNWPDRDEYEYIEIKGIGVLDIWDPEKCIRSFLG